VTASPIWEHAPAEHTKAKFGMRSHVDYDIIRFKFYRNRLTGFQAVRRQKWGSSIDFKQLPLQQISTTVLPVIWYNSYKQFV